VKKFKMKFATGIILVLFVSFGQSVILKCDFHMSTWDYVGAVYECSSRTENTGNSTIIKEVRGTHSNGKVNEDVESFRENGNSLTFIPTNLASFFPNLKVIFITAPLLQLSSSDLKSFPNLVLFISEYGKFTNIDGDLFQYTRQLKDIRFYSPELKSVGENLLTGLNDLVFVYFISSGCIGSVQANSPQKIQELSQKLLLNCPPLEALTMKLLQ
jgi:hypothetical protein